MKKDTLKSKNNISNCAVSRLQALCKRGERRIRKLLHNSFLTLYKLVRWRNGKRTLPAARDTRTLRLLRKLSVLGSAGSNPVLTTNGE